MKSVRSLQVNGSTYRKSTSLQSNGEGRLGDASLKPNQQQRTFPRTSFMINSRVPGSRRASKEAVEIFLVVLKYFFRFVQIGCLVLEDSAG